MEEVDDSPLELRPPPVGRDGVGGEGLPDDGLADVGGDEEGDSGGKAVAAVKDKSGKRRREKCQWITCESCY